MDDTPWITAMEHCMKPSFTSSFQPFECHNVYTILASERGKWQLLPTLRILAQNAAAGSTPPESAPSEETISSLLSLFDIDMPSLRIETPMPGGRMSGSAVAFVAEVNLGMALEARLAGSAEESTSRGLGSGGKDTRMEGLSSDGDRKMKPETEIEPVFDETFVDVQEVVAAGGGPGDSTMRAAVGINYGDALLTGAERDDSGRYRRGMEAKPLPPLERCEVRVAVDGAVTTRVRVKPAENNQKQRKVMSAVVPVYKSRCSEHPAQAATAAAAAGGSEGAWGNNQNVWHVEARTVDRVCTSEAFGSHAIHAELACCTGDVPASAILDGAATPTEANPPSSRCEVFANAAPVEYFHTANGADSSSLWVEAGEAGQGSGSLLDPPPEIISVSLYLESAPEAEHAVVAVPRWSSDGEVWEVSYHMRCCCLMNAERTQVSVQGGCSPWHSASLGML